MHGYTYSKEVSAGQMLLPLMMRRPGRGQRPRTTVRWRAAFAAMLAITLVAVLGSAPAATAYVDPPAGDVPRPTPADLLVLVNEVTNGGPGGDASSDDFVEIKNFSGQTVDISGWKIFHCSRNGNRFKDPRVVIGSGVALAPGEIYTAAGDNADLGGAKVQARYTTSASDYGFGIYVEDEYRNKIDSIAVGSNQPWQTMSECGHGPNLTNTLNYLRADSWQRVSRTGDPAADWMKAIRTPAAENTTVPVPGFSHRDGVYINEITTGGVSSNNDDFLELKNYGAAPADISGWSVYKCGASGRILPDYLQSTVPASTSLAPGDTYTFGYQTGYSGGFGTGPGKAQSPLAASFAADSFGAVVLTPTGEVVDGVAVSAENVDHACQPGQTKLRNVADFVAAESFQRIARTGDLTRDFIVGPRTPNAPNATAENSIAATAAALRGRDGVRVSEIATDPTTGLPTGAIAKNYVELGNYSGQPVDVSGWTVRSCGTDGRRSRSLLFTVPAGRTIQPGQTYLVAKSGTAAAATAQQTYSGTLNLVGTGVWVADASGALVDNVSVLHRNAGDSPNDVYSPCTQGRSLTTYQPDRAAGETYQRSRFTGINDDDFLVKPATPGRIDEHPWVDPTVPAPGATDPVAVATSHPADTPVGRSVREHFTDRLLGRVADQDGDTLTATIHGGQRVDLASHLTAAFTGASPAAPLPGREGIAETAVAVSDVAAASARRPVVAADSGYLYPYQRFVLSAPSTDAAGPTLAPGTQVVWSGATDGRNELQMYVWNAIDSVWRLADAASGSAQGALTLIGTLHDGDIDAGRVDVLVQNGPRTRSTIVEAVDGEFQDPGNYDLSIVHTSDPQYLTESYPEVYTQAMSWILANRAGRKIAGVANTGDIVQNYERALQDPARAAVEYQRAARIHGLLDNADLPNSVAPGNHDNKNGTDGSLFNEYFGPDRYAGKSWYGGSVTPTDNMANYVRFKKAGSSFVVISLPYGYTNRDIEWASQVVADHPSSNIIIATHEHVSPANPAATPPLPAQRLDDQIARWMSRGDVLWDQVIAPNRNVVMVLSGHRHGVGAIVSENAGGIDGHTVVEMVADYQNYRGTDGARTTAFQRLLQVDLNGGKIAVDTYSQSLGARYGYPYDYAQAVNEAPDSATVPSHERPWNILAQGPQGRYTEADDEFTVDLRLQYAKSVTTTALELATNVAELASASVDGSGTVRAVWPESATAPTSIARLWWVAATDATGRAVRSAPLVVAASPAASLTIAEPQPGSPLQVRGENFLPKEKVTLRIEGLPAPLATVGTGGNGGFTTTVTLPADLPDGTHTIVATGAESGRSASASVTTGGR